MKRKKVALYDPYLDVIGGGEKHILSILQILDEKGYDINIFWDEDLSEPIQKKLNLSFSKLTFLPNCFKNTSSMITKLAILKDFDMFFYVTDGSYFFSSAKQNYVFCMVPQQSLYQMTPLNRLKTSNYYFISNSQYTRTWLNKWNLSSSIIYPYIDNDFLTKSTTKKQPFILTVGRFFRHLHSKRHDMAIKTFKKFKKQNPDSEFKLILAGNLKQEDETYFNELVKMADNDPAIIFKQNIPYSELLELYKKALVYWHFAGYEVDEQKNPEQVEHLGITPLEAMASCCITFCYNAGGPKEIITDGENGFLFNNEDELITKMNTIIDDSKKQTRITENARKYVEQNFSYEEFKKNVLKVIDTN